MKFQNILNILFSVIIIALTAILVYITTERKVKTNPAKPEKTERKQLVRIDSYPELILNGIVAPQVTEEVKLNVSGKIDNDNRSLKVGSTFKKNEILIKIERTSILYEILSSRSEFKSLIKQALPIIKTKIPEEYQKWILYEKQVKRTSSLPNLPNLNSKKEEELIDSLNIFGRYYSSKQLDKRAEDYIYVAPFNGVIIKSNINSTSTIQKGEATITIAKNNTSQIISHVSLSDLKRVTKNDTIDVFSYDDKVIGQAVFLRTGHQISDSSSVEVFFSIIPKINNLNQLAVQLKIPGQPAKIPNSAIKNKQIEFFLNDKLFSFPIEIIKTVGDSTLVQDLPQSSFILTYPEPG